MKGPNEELRVALERVNAPGWLEGFCVDLPKRGSRRELQDKLASDWWDVGMVVFALCDVFLAILAIILSCGVFKALERSSMDAQVTSLERTIESMLFVLRIITPLMSWACFFLQVVDILLQNIAFGISAIFAHNGHVLDIIVLIVIHSCGISGILPTPVVRILGTLRAWRLLRMHHRRISYLKNFTMDLLKLVEEEQERYNKAQQAATDQGRAAAKARQHIRALKEEIDMLREALVVAAEDAAKEGNYSEDILLNQEEIQFNSQSESEEEFFDN